MSSEPFEAGNGISRKPAAAPSSDQRYRDLIEDLGIIVWEADAATGNFTFINHCVEPVLGYPVSTWLENPRFFHGRIHPEDRDWVLSFCSQETHAARDHEMEYRMLAADGSVVWMRDVVHVIRDAEGNPQQLRGIMLNITERVRAQEELARERDLLDALLDNIPDLIYFKDHDSRFLRINRAQAAALGLSRPELAIGKGDDDFFPDELAGPYRADDRRVLADAETIVNKLEPTRRADGEQRWLLTTKIPLSGPTGEVVGLAGISRDVTHQRQAEEQLVHILTSARCLLWLAEVSADPAAPDGFDWVLHVSNESAAEQFLPVRRKPGQSYSDAWYASKLSEDRVRIARTGNDALRSGAAGYTLEFRCRRLDGRVVWLYEDARIEVLGPGRWRVVGVCTDITERKLAEEAHARSEERLAEAQRLAHLGNWEIDLVTNSLYWGEETYRILGYTPYAVRPSRALFMRLVHPEDRASVARAIQEAIHATHPYQLEHRVVRPDGTVRWVQEQGEVHRGPAGRPERFVGSVLDITERKQVEEELRSREERHRTLLQSLPQRVFFKDRACRFVSANHHFAADLGITPAEIIGKTDHDFFPSDLADKYREDDRRIMRARAAETLEERNVIQGEERFVEVVKAPVFSDSGDVVGVLGLFTDISERKRAQLALMESERRLRAHTEMFEGLTRQRSLWHGNLISAFRAITRATAVTLQVSRASIWLLNEERSDLRCADLYEATDHRHSQGTILRAAEYPAYFAALEQGRVIDADDAPTDPRTSEFAVTYLAPLGIGSMLDAPIRIGGQVRGVLCLEHTGEPRRWALEEETLAGSAADLIALAIQSDERRQAEEKLKTFAAQLELTNRELQDFAYVASHDLQEPLRKILMFGDRLQLKCADALGDQGLDYLHRMQNAAERMQTLINDLLAFSRVTTKAQPLRRVDLNKVVREVLQDLEASIEESRATLELEVLPQIDADSTQVRQLFQNLIGNALKFRSPHAAPRVRISSRPHPDPDKAGDFLQVLVADNGIGFDEKYLSRIFAPFQRLHGRSEYAGTGIGLAICRKIAERHTWGLTATSAPGEGATFILTLPCLPRASDDGAGE